MNWLRKWWTWFFVVLLVALGAFALQSWLQKKSAPEYKTTKIEKGAITASVAASGTLSPVVSVQVGSQVSGQLKEVLADFNSEVKQGQLIARIDPETYEHRVRQAQADVDAARSQVMTQQANIAAQRAEVLKAEVNAGEAKRDLERKQQLVEKGFISAAEGDKAHATYNALAEQVNTAKAQAGVAAANARNAEAIVKQRDAALAQARTDLERTAIKAPVTGIVIKRSVEKGQTVAASLQAPELFVIAENLTDMQVDTAIDESEIGRVRAGQKATFTVDAFPSRNFEGTVQQIRKAALNVSNVVTYTVVVSASNPRKELLPGMTANVRIVTDSRDDVFKVANAALRFRPAGERGERSERSERPGRPSTSAAQATAPAATASTASTASNAGGPEGQMSGMQGVSERLERELQLSDEQKARLDTIFAGMREKMAASREVSDSDRRQLMERSRSEMRTQIAAMLTPEQQRKYEEIAAEGGERRGGGRRGRIYTLDEKGQPKALEVRFGLTDGRMTEVVSPEMKEGMDIITGTSQAQQDGRQQRPAGPRMF